MSARPTTTQWVASMSAAESFVEWVNHEADIPEGYYFSVGAPGQKFVRIIMHSHPNEGSVHAFVALDTGDLLKAAGWKAPAKGERGNLITDQDAVRERFTWSGGYLYKR